MLAKTKPKVNNNLVITSWEQLEVALADDEPMPIIAIRGQRPPRQPLLGAAPTEERGGLLDHAVVWQELSALAHSIRGETARPSILEALIMESPQSIGSIAAATSLTVESVSQTANELAEIGIAEFIIHDGIERVTLTLPETQ